MSSAAHGQKDYYIPEPSPWPITAMISVLTLLAGTALAMNGVGAGTWMVIGGLVWQLDRAEQKRDLAATLTERAGLPAVKVVGMVEDPARLRYRPIAATGRYLPEHQVLIEGRRDTGRSGFHVVTPLEVSGSGILLLVNRGWIPARANGGPTDAPVPDGELSLVGEADVPSPPALVLHGSDAAARDLGCALALPHRGAVRGDRRWAGTAGGDAARSRGTGRLRPALDETGPQPGHAPGLCGSVVRLCADRTGALSASGLRAGAVWLGLDFIRHAWRLYRSDGDAHAMRTFGYSILYLTLLFAFLLADHYLGAVLALFGAWSV